MAAVRKAKRRGVTPHALRGVAAAKPKALTARVVGSPGAKANAARVAGRTQRTSARPAPSPVPRARIRTATLDDLDALVAMEALFPSDRMTRRAWRRFLVAANAVALVAEWPRVAASPVKEHGLAGNLLLLTRLDRSVARVYSVVVAPAARGQGLGEALVAAAERAARARGCTAVSLEVRTDNPAALALYAKRGYGQTRALPAYYSDDADGVRLVKTLRPAKTER